MTEQHQALFSFDLRLKYDPSMFLTGLVRFTHAITLIETFFLITISSAFSLGTFGVKCSIHAPLSSTSACSAVSRQWPQQTSLAAAPNKEAALWHFLLNHTVHCTVVMVTRGCSVLVSGDLAEERLGSHFESDATMFRSALTWGLWKGTAELYLETWCLTGMRDVCLIGLCLWALAN